MPTILFVDNVGPDVLERLRANTPQGFEFRLASSDPAERRTQLREADYLMVWGAPIPPDLLASAPRAVMVQKVGQGVDNIDLAGARARDIPVCNAGAANTTSVAEFAILLILAVYRRLPALDAAVRDAAWPRFQFRPVSRELSGKRVGIIGLGNIGRKVAQRLRGWECQVAFNDTAEIPETVQRELNVKPMSRDDLLCWADVVTLHVDLNPTSKGLIGARELALLRPDAILVNCARGPVVDEAALVEALRSGRLLGAGLDVQEQEPPDPRSPLLQLDNVVLSPHVAAGTWDSLERTIREAMENCARHARGERPHSIQNGV